MLGFEWLAVLRCNSTKEWQHCTEHTTNNKIEILVPRMHFVHRVLEESSIRINIIYYEGLTEPVLVYFRKTRADVMRTDDISAPKFLASVKLPSEIKSVALVGSIFCMWTTYDFLVFCNLLHSLEFEEVAKTDLRHICPARSVLYSSGESIILVESHGARYLSTQRGCGELTIRTKNRIVDATFAENMMYAIETDGDKSFLNTYEVCIDMALQRFTVEIERTSYLIALGRKSSYVFSDGLLHSVQGGKISSSMVLPRKRIKGCLFITELSRLFVFTEDGCILVVLGSNRLESLGNVGPVIGIFLFGKYLLTFGLQSRIYAMHLGKRCLELVGNVSADHKFTLTRQCTEEATMAKHKLCGHKYRKTLNVCRSHDSFLEINLRHVCVENRSATSVLCKSRCPAKSIFVGENGVALLREGNIFVYSISSNVLKEEKHVKAVAGISEILLFKDNNFLELHGSAWPSMFAMEGDIYVTYMENTISWYLAGDGALKLSRRREFKFRVCGLVVFRKFLVLHSGAVMWVFDCDLDAFVFVQILDSDIRGCFVENTFLYVLTKEATVSIYKMHGCGRMELPVRMCLEERHATVKGSIVQAERRVYLFVGYDFISMDTPQDTVEMVFSKNTLYVHTHSSFCAFHVVLDECVDNAHRMGESRVLLQYSASSRTYVVATSMDSRHAREHKEQNLEHSDASRYRLVILNRNSGSTVHVYRGSNLVNYRDFKEKVLFTALCGKNVVCAFRFRCLVLIIGKKQLVAKSQIKLPSEICGMQEAGNDLYVKTRIHSVFKYTLSENTLVLVCSDILNRRISTFKVLADNIIVFSDVSGFIGVLEERGHTYETRMSWYVGETVVHFRAECYGIIYETSDRKVGELICVDSRLFSMLEAMYFHLFLKHHEEDTVKYEYPIVNALPACFEMSGLIADNLNAFGSSLAADHFRLCALLKLVYGSWMMKNISR